MSTVPPPDDVAHQDGVLMAELTGLNTLLGRYVVRFLDADTGRAEPVSTEDELTLADRMRVAAEGIQARATRRERHGDPSPLIHHTSDTKQS